MGSAGQVRPTTDQEMGRTRVDHMEFKACRAS